jgi:hypothetical protein
LDYKQCAPGGVLGQDDRITLRHFQKNREEDHAKKNYFPDFPGRADVRRSPFPGAIKGPRPDFTKRNAGQVHAH